MGAEVLDILVVGGVAVAPGSAFGPGGHGRVRIALTESPGALSDAMTRLARFWAAC